MKVLLIVAVILAIQPAQAENAKGTSQGKTAPSTKQADTTKHNGTDPNSPSVSVTVNNAPPPPNPQPKTEEFDETMRVQRRLAFYTGLLVLVGFATAVVIGWQSIETRKAATAATRAVEATERSIGHMEEANRISRENMQAGQRAYIAFPMLDFQTLRVADDTGTPIAFRFRLAVENTGNTPALNLIMRVNYWGQDGDQGLPSNYDFRDFAPLDGPAEDYPMYLSAKAKTYSPLLSIPRETIIRLNERQMRLFFYGWATYRDVFEGTPLHRTEFCHELKVLEIAGDRVVFELSAYRKHNSQT